MFTYTITTAEYRPIVNVPGNSNQYPRVFIRGSVTGDIVDAL